MIEIQYAMSMKSQVRKLIYFEVCDKTTIELY